VIGTLVNVNVNVNGGNFIWQSLSIWYIWSVPSSSALIPMSICSLQCLFSHSFTTYEWPNRDCDVQIYIGITSRWTGYKYPQNIRTHDQCPDPMHSDRRILQKQFGACQSAAFLFLLQLSKNVQFTIWHCSTLLLWY
jgi:hypothetical protein